MMTLVRECAVFIVALALIFLTVGALGRAEMILAPDTTAGQIWTVGLTSTVLVWAGIGMSGGVHGPSLPSRFLSSAVMTAAVVAIGAGGAWLWVNIPDQRMQVLTGLFGIAGIGIIVIYFGSLIGGLPRVLRLRLAVFLAAFLLIGTPIDVVLTWRVVDYPVNDLKYVWAFLVAIFPFALLDSLWIHTVMEKLYIEALDKAVLGGVDTQPDGSERKTQPRLGWGLIAWAVICGGLATFAIVPHAIDHAWWVGLLWGAGFGFITSAFYALTNLTALRAYTLKLALLDVAWGIVLAAGIAWYTHAATTVSLR